MKSIDRKQLEIQNLEAEIAAVHDKMDALEELSHHLSNKIILAKRQLLLIKAQKEGTLNV